MQNQIVQKIKGNKVKRTQIKEQTKRKKKREERLTKHKGRDDK